MSPLQPVWFVPRPRRGLVLLVPALLLATVVGCGHRRSSMRPVYLTPQPAATVDPCPTTAVPSTAVPVPGGEPSLAPPAEPASPAPPSGGISSPSGGISSPSGGISGPSLDSSATPASTSPPRPSSRGDEPTLELSPAEPSKGPAGNSNNPPALEQPKSPTSMRGTRPEPSGRFRQASLRQQLRPFVNDPQDLFSPPKADRPWKYVVLHHSASAQGSYDEIDREHRKVLGWTGCGYHFVIGNGTGSPDGQIEVARRWSEQKNGVHCRNGKNAEVNEYGIGICLVGDLDKSPPTPKQIASARALVAYLSERYRIPGTRVETHAHLAASPTVCPGKHFPTNDILGTGKVVVR